LLGKKRERNCSKDKAVMAILKNVIKYIPSSGKIFSPYFFNMARTVWGMMVALPAQF